MSNFNDKGLEKHIQKNIFDYLKLKNIFAIHIENENQNARSPAFANFRKSQGVVAGAPDICIFLKNGVTLWVEVKSNKGILSKAQKEFHATLQNLEHNIFVARSIFDVEKILKVYGY